MRDKHHCIVTADRSLQQLLLYWTISRQKSFVCCLEIGQYLWDNFVGQQQTCYDVRCSDNKVGHVLRCEWSTCLLTIQRPTGSSGFRSSIRPSVRPLTLIACVTVLHWWVSVFGRISVKLGVSYELELLQEIKGKVMVKWNALFRQRGAYRPPLSVWRRHTKFLFYCNTLMSIST